MKNIDNPICVDCKFPFVRSDRRTIRCKECNVKKRKQYFKNYYLNRRKNKVENKKGNEPMMVPITTIEEIKWFRKELDALINRQINLGVIFRIDMPDSVREVKFRIDMPDSVREVKKHLIESKMWLGKCLEVLGSELPREFQDKAQDMGADKAEKKDDKKD